MGVSKNNGTPKSSILIGCSIINHPFWGTPIFGNTYISLSSTTRCIPRGPPAILQHGHKHLPLLSRCAGRNANVDVEGPCDKKPQPRGPTPSWLEKPPPILPMKQIQGKWNRFKENETDSRKTHVFQMQTGCQPLHPKNWQPANQVNQDSQYNLSDNDLQRSENDELS